MNIEIKTENFEDSKHGNFTVYKVVCNGVVLTSSRDAAEIQERALHIKIGANAMLKHITQMNVTLIGE